MFGPYLFNSRNGAAVRATAPGTSRRQPVDWKETVMSETTLNQGWTRAASGFSRRGFAARVWQTLLAWQQREHDRAALGSLDERMLSDIGLTRAQVQWECAKPFWQV
jgi:uncharacterized protein YjiS (DUF1127 family)